mmetsp:Transcript_61401/g.91221  ORF Transcript_61401/g.91221 Transcript_61401/m.91221 type:complete len:117 (-) Transcript_61401:304-654(-)
MAFFPCLLQHFPKLKRPLHIFFHCLRFLFFAKTEESSGFLEEKLKDDRKQLCSIAALLHMSARTIVGKTMLDLKDVKEVDDMSRIDESVYESQSLTVDEGDQMNRGSSDSEMILSP